MKKRILKVLSVICVMTIFAAAGASAEDDHRLVSNSVTIRASERPEVREAAEQEETELPEESEESGIAEDIEAIEEAEETGEAEIVEDAELIEEPEIVEETEPIEETEEIEASAPAFTVSIAFVDMPAVLTEGDTLTIAAVIDGEVIEPAYQWQKLVDGKWMDIVGANGSTYSFVVTVESMGDSYRVQVEETAEIPVQEEPEAETETVRVEETDNENP